VLRIMVQYDRTLRSCMITLPLQDKLMSLLVLSVEYDHGEQMVDNMLN